MSRVNKRALHQQEGEKVKSTTMPIDLQKGTQSEQLDSQFEAYPYTGYHRSTISDYLNGSKGSPYSRQYTKDGKLVSCGINWYESHVQRLDMMLRATGEPVALWRRKWTGETCPKCYVDRSNRANYRCDICFGTGFVGGFVRFINTREPDGRIFIRLGPTEETLGAEDSGLTQHFNPAGWTLPTPIVRNWDIAIRYDQKTGEETWRYEVLNVTRNKGFFNVPTVQNFTLSRLDRTDPKYRLRWVDLHDNLNGLLSGDHDSEDALQTQIENRFGDGAGDKGFSDGYRYGFIRGTSEGLANLDYVDVIDLDNNSLVDDPYGSFFSLPEDKQAWLMGYQTGYRDGFAEGQEARRTNGQLTWQPPRTLDPAVATLDPATSLPTDTPEYDEIARNPTLWKP